MRLKYLAYLSFLWIVSACLIIPGFAVADVSTGVSDNTITIDKSGAMHVKILHTIPDNAEGATNYHFELQKTYRPENVSVYDPTTGKALSYTVKEYSTAIAYDVSFDKPYYKGYTLAVEYDNHNRIINEGSGVYSLGMRSGVNTQRVEWKYKVILPEENFTYLNYNKALEAPDSVEKIDGRTVLYFSNVSSPPAEFSWEIKFRAIGIEDELRKTDPGTPMALPGMEFLLSAAAVLICAYAIRSRR